MTERALCVCCWEWREYRDCRTVWLAGLFPVICSDCEGLRGPRVAHILELEERLTLEREESVL